MANEFHTKQLRGGYTTGACAAAGAKAAIMLMKGHKVEHLQIEALDGTMLDIPVKDVSLTAKGAVAEIVKHSGDDPDITDGVSVFTSVEQIEDGAGIHFFAGEGIGTVTKKGLSVPPGEPSINPGPRRLIIETIQKIAGADAAFNVIISIPGGRELAKKTLNPVLGIEGGLSIIGTTGVLRPMSEEGFKNSLVPQIDVALEAGYKTQVFVPGKIGQDAAASHGIPEEAVVQTSNFIGFMLESAADRGLDRVMLFGHIGKLAKVAAGTFYTHNRQGDGRMEAIAAYAAANGLPPEYVRKILTSTTTEAALPIIDDHGLQRVYDELAARASERAERYVFGQLKVGTVMVTLQGRVLGMDMNAKKMGEAFMWDIT